MGLFNRCKHEWVLKARQSYTISERFAWESSWTETGDQTVLRYVCSKCKKDRSRTVMGEITLAEAKEVFPRP